MATALRRDPASGPFGILARAKDRRRLHPETRSLLLGRSTGDFRGTQSF